MNLKLIGILTFLFMMLIPVTSAFALVVSSPEPYDYNNGLLDDDNIIKTNNFPIEYYDNDLSTRKSLVYDPYYVEFNYPVDLTGFYYNFNITFPSTKILIHHYDDDGIRIHNHSIEGKDSSSSYDSLDIKRVFKISLVRSGSNGNVNVNEIDFFGTYDTSDGMPEGNEPPQNIDFNVNETTASFTYDLPTDEGFSHIEIHANDQVYETDKSSFDIDGLSADTEYEVVFYSVDNEGNKSKGVTVTIKTDKEPEEPVPKDVKNLEIEASYDRVDLYWENPDTQYFEMAKIYRKAVENKTSFNINPFASTVAYAAEFKPIFETNGTYFADLSIEPETDYEYKVTTTYQGLESSGVTIKTEVPKASIIDLDKLETPFDVKDLLTTGNGLLLLVGGFVLLGLAFMLVPRIIKLIVGAFSNSPAHGNQQIKEGRQPREQRQMSTQPRQAREPRMTTRE